MAVEYNTAAKQRYPSAQQAHKELDTPAKLGGKPDFLAAYGLELDDDDDEEDVDENGIDGERTPLADRLAKKKNKSKTIKKPGLLTKSLVSPRRQSDGSNASPASPSSSPRAHVRRTSLAGLVRSRSPSSATGESFNTKTTVLPSPSTILAKHEIDYGRAPRQQSSSSPATSSAAHAGPTVTTVSSPTALRSFSPRRGHLEEETDDEDGEESLIDDASSASHYPPSDSIAHNDAMVEARAASIASSHLKASDVDAAYVGESTLPELKADDSASSINDGAESWESGGVKVGGAIGLMSPPSLSAQNPAKATTAVAMINASPPPPALPPRRRVSRGEETAETKKEAAKDAKEEAKRVAAEKKASMAEEKVDKEKQESKARREARERKILLKSYEELEVERFLGDFGKHVRQVQSTGFIDSAAGVHAWPERDDWRYKETGKLNVAGFAFAYVFSFFSYLSPTRFADIQGAPSTPAGEDVLEFIPEEQNFRIAALRANAERLYLTALPMYEGLFARARRVWRWDSIIKSFLWCSSYFVFWYRGMLLPALFALIIWNVLRVRAYPPKPEALRAMLVKQQTRTKELEQARNAKAEDIIRQAQEEPEGPTSNAAAKKKKKGRYGLAADATRRYGKMATLLTSALADVHERIKNFVMWRSVPATWRALTLLFLSMVITFFSTPWMMARFPGLLLGVCFFFVAPIAEHRPQWLGVEWRNPFDFLLAGVPSDAQHAMEVLRRRAASGEALTGDKDVLRWIRGVGDDDDDEDVMDHNIDNRTNEREAGGLMPSMTALEGAPGGAAVSSAVDRAAAGGSAAVDWKKWRARVNKGREMAVMGSEMLSGQRPLELPRLGGGAATPATTAGSTSTAATPAQDSATMTSRMLAGMTSGINWGLDSLESTSNRKLLERGLDPDEVRSASDGVYWAVHQGSCGHVVVTPERIRFRSFFARKKPSTDDGMTSKNNKETAADQQTPVLDPITGQCLVDEKQMEQVTVRTLVDVRLESVVQLKKTRSVNVPGVCGIDGLEVRSRGGKVYHFSSIVKRDEAFNRILALAPQNWNKM